MQDRRQQRSIQHDVPITSIMNTFVEVRAMEATSKLASRVEVAMYFATDPKPGTAICNWKIIVNRFRNMIYRNISHTNFELLGEF